MKTTIQTVCLAVTVAFCSAWPAVSNANSSLPNEPSEDCLVEQSYDTILGLLFRDYSVRRNGQVDYRTACHIMGVSYDDPASGEPTVAPYPFMYWYDANQDGQWEMWIDRDEEGHLDHAARYDWRQGEKRVASSKTW
jgi:hypothetical protein